MRLHYLELIWFSTYAELRAERSRSYLGFLWWLLDPALQMGIYYLVFSVILKTASHDYVPFLLIGLTIWQWFKSCVSHGGSAIWQNLGLIRQVKLPAMVFPSVQILADTVKFLFILALLILILWAIGFPPNVSYAALPLVLLTTLLFASAAGYLVAALMPLVPDLRFVIEQLLFIFMFVSGIVFSVNDVTPDLRDLLVDAARGILMHGEWPSWAILARVGAFSVVFYLATLYLIHRTTPRYVKLAS